MTEFRAAEATDVGQVRENNQDLALMGDDLFAVADGMGGHRGGETAARIAIDTFRDLYSEATLDGLVRTVETANDRVVSEASTTPGLKGMGTTLCVLAAVSYDDAEVIGIVNVGDSRAYLVDDAELVQVTRDHTLVQMLVDQGQIDEDEADHHPQRNILTRALGIDTKVVVDSFLLRPVTGDRYLICSDGLYGEVDDATMLQILQAEDDPAEAARRLVQRANDAGGHDNITCIVVDVVVGDGLDEPPDVDERVISSDTGETELPDGTDLLAPPLLDEGADGDRGGSDGGARALDGAALAAAPGGVLVVDDEDHASAAEARGYGDVAFAPAEIADRPVTARPRRFTWRTAFFLAAALLVVLVALGATGFYARNTFFVTDRDGEVVLFRGRPGGVLWFQPTVERTTDIAIDDLPPALRREVQQGKGEPSLDEADDYITFLRDEITRAQDDEVERGGATAATIPSTSTSTTSTSLVGPPPGQ